MADGSPKLSIYRPMVARSSLRTREHHPYCSWCTWRCGSSCYNAINNPCGTNVPVYEKNDEGQCDEYSPDLFTRVMQLVSFRKFVERQHAEKE